MSRSLLVLLIVVLVLGAGTFALTRGSGGEAMGTSVAVSEAMGSDTTGYARAEAVRPFTFPADHGPHPDYKTEWWYVTGNLDAEAASAEPRHFGYELTIFRIAAAPPDSGRARMQPASLADSSAWRTDQFYMAHFALTDVQGETMRSFERFSRGAAGLAGAQADPFRVWLEDWHIASAPDSGFFPLRLKTRTEDGYGVDLALRASKRKVLQGDRGLSQKGPGAGNASYYYSFTRLATAGQVFLPGDTLAVQGRSWMDREWSTSALGEEQVGWDWFALQLKDGRDLMYYQLRNQDGSASRFSEGVLVGPEGERTAITRENVNLEITERWTSPRGGTYPSGWRLRVPEENLSLRITPYLDDQEMQTSVRYWEGAVRIEGTAGGEPVRGSGYVEMTGYADEGPGKGEAGRSPLP